MKQIFAVLLTIVLCITSSIPVKAAENQEVYSFIVDTRITAEDALRLGYDNLSEEAKEIFNIVIQMDSELYSYHKENFDSNFQLEHSSTPPSRSVNDALSIISEGLRNLNLPVQVREALTMLSSGISAAAADGPLLGGDIYCIAVSLYTAVVIAQHWDDIEAVWDDVINLFRQAYGTFSSEVNTAFNDITSDIDSEINIPAFVSVQVNNQDIRIDGDIYRCNTRVNSFTSEKGKFYPALIKDNMLWVCPTNIPFKLARLVMDANIQNTGIVTYKSISAQAICGNEVIRHPAHEQHSTFYLPHYHKANTYGNPLNAHAWYVVI